MVDAERNRLQEVHEGKQPWYRWGPYLSERQWGTVREDYSPYGNAWDFFPHEHARSRTYRWGEDGLMGISDDQGLACFALALWNEADPILKERLYGLTNSEGNHGEDVKEYYFFLDNTPTHSYMKALYKYPQRAYPYSDLLETNRHRGKFEPEYELIDTGVFSEDRYFDVMMEYAKVDPHDVLIRVSVTNHGPEAAPIHVLPTLWFRNTWAWGYDDKPTPVDCCQACTKEKLRKTRYSWYRSSIMSWVKRGWRVREHQNCSSQRMKPITSGYGVCPTIRPMSKMASMTPSSTKRSAKSIQRGLAPKWLLTMPW